MEPINQQALWLAGMAAAEVKEYKAALRHFLILQPMLYNDQENLSQLHKLIAKAEHNISKDEFDAVAKAVAAEVESAPILDTIMVEIHVSVSLDDAINDKVSANDVVFVYAKAMDGSPMPLTSNIPITPSGASAGYKSP